MDSEKQHDGISILKEGGATGGHQCCEAKSVDNSQSLLAVITSNSIENLSGDDNSSYWAYRGADREVAESLSLMDPHDTNKEIRAPELDAGHYHK